MFDHPVLSGKFSRASFLLLIGSILAALILSIATQSARAQEIDEDWFQIRILPETGNWNYPGYFVLTAREAVTVSWEIKCTEGGCGGREAEFVYDYTFSAGETKLVGWGHQCYRWQFDPINWPHGYIAEPELDCFEVTPTPTDPPAQDTPTSTPVTATPTVTGTVVTTTPVTPDTPTPTVTGTIITTPPATPDTATPTVTGTIITTPPATPGTGTPDTDGSPTPTPDGSPTPVPPAQMPAETPRSQIIAVTGADLSASRGPLPRIFLSLGIVFLGLGLVRLGISRKSKRN
jgi:hypothetical protein